MRILLSQGRDQADNLVRFVLLLLLEIQVFGGPALGLTTVNTKSLGSLRLLLHATKLCPNLKFSMLPLVDFKN